MGSAGGAQGATWHKEAGSHPQPFPFHQKPARPHPRHGAGSYLYGCSPVCVLRCLVRFADRGKILPQYLVWRGGATMRQSHCRRLGHLYAFLMWFLQLGG